MFIYLFPTTIFSFRGRIGGRMDEAVKNGILFWQEKCLYVMPHQNLFPASLHFWTRAIWNCGGSFSLSTWLICNHLGDTFKVCLWSCFQRGLTKEGRSTLSLDGTITIPYPRSYSEWKGESEPSTSVHLPCLLTAGTMWPAALCGLFSMATTTLAFMPSLLW